MSKDQLTIILVVLTAAAVAYFLAALINYLQQG